MLYLGRVVAIVLSCQSLLLATGTSPTTAPADEFRDQIRGQDEVMRKGGLEAILKYYNATTPEEKKAAMDLAAFQLASLHLQDAAESKFGKGAGDAAVRQAGGCSNADFEEAKIEIESDHARILWKGEVAPTEFVKVDHLWKVDVAALLAVVKDKEGSMPYVEMSIPVIQKFADEIKAGKYATLNDLNAAIEKRFSELATPAN